MDVNWEMLIGEAVTQLLKIFIPVFVVLVCKWVVEIYKKLSEKNPMAAEIVAYAARLGYAAAEDYFRNLKTATGDDKMSYAIFRAKEYLTNAGITLDEDVIKDAITSYGVANYKFSWVKPTLDISFGEDNDHEEIPEEAEETEEDCEPVAANHLRIRYSDNDHHADHNESSEQSAGSDQADAANEDGK